MQVFPPEQSAGNNVEKPNDIPVSNIATTLTKKKYLHFIKREKSSKLFFFFFLLLNLDLDLQIGSIIIAKIVNVLYICFFIAVTQRCSSKHSRQVTICVHLICNYQHIFNIYTQKSGWELEGDLASFQRIKASKLSNRPL